MCLILQGPQCMTRCGIGPMFSLITVSWGLVTGWLTIQYPAVSRISGSSPCFFVVPGTVLVAGGTILYLVALHTFNRGYRCNQLLTQGPYTLVRHPIYAAWILLICPGVV